MPANIPPIPTALDAYRELEEMDVEVVPAHFRQQKALARDDGLLAIDYEKLENSAEELELLLHEIGHFSRGGFYTQQSGSIQRAQAEARATRHVFEQYYPPQLLASLMQAGDTEPWQLADRLGLPESFVREMLCFYTSVRQIDFSSYTEELPSSLPPAQPSGGGWLSVSTPGGHPVRLLLRPAATQQDIQAALLALDTYL